MNATVKDVMSTHVIAVREIATFKEIATRLREQGVSAFPVIDREGKVIGVVSEADLLPKEALEGARSLACSIGSGVAVRKPGSPRPPRRT